MTSMRTVVVYYSSTGNTRRIAEQIAAQLGAELAEVTMRAENWVELAGEDALRMQKLLDVIEELDDVQDVYHNAEIGA